MLPIAPEKLPQLSECRDRQRRVVQFLREQYRLHRGDGDTGRERSEASRVQFPERAKPREIRVDVTTLDRAIGHWERLDYLKIDIEGGELDCLEGGAEILSRHRPIISFECGYDAFTHYGKAISDFLAYAAANDCKIFDLFGREIYTEEELQSLMGQMWDFYFVPTSKIRDFLTAIKS
jgi:hypothetical protein